MWTASDDGAGVGLSLFFGTLFALLLDRKFFGRGFIRTLLITVLADAAWSRR
jgi:ABC-type sugar transport system permease subunit